MENQVEKFSHLWETYVTGVRSRLQTLAENGKLTETTANEALHECAQCWQNDYEPEGRWVAALSTDDIQRGRQVRKVLAEQQTFTAEQQSGCGAVPQVIGSVGGAAIGFGIASAFHMGTIGLISTTAVATGVGLIGGNRYAVSKQDQARRAVVDAYVHQLDSYYQSVVALLNA